MLARKNAVSTLSVYLIIFLLPALVNSIIRLKTALYLFQTIDYVVGAAILIIIYQKFFAPTQMEKGAQTKTSQIILWGILGAFLALIGQLAASYLDQLIFHTTTSSANTSAILTVIRSYPYYLIMAVVAAPIMEELVFRRTIFGYLTPFTGKFGAALISSVFFAIAHNDNHLLTYTAIGLVFCYLYQRTGKIATSMISHMVMNGIVILMLLYR
ncbi:CPBP family intramembrane glutamic endopeptidase [Loigolactobacillus backii]|uniref:CAAX protease n=1 Tax=Loigolactobacillus backii TaxID=375175 RepID=A0A192H3Q5_9LACO|nr:type II CAAX endopeptidase family protein [Loigolactobacillus backii]ANK59179.1 CAAX protease [Loigolactobacillus backii]ANK62591.1 CAAX protease [Loigolactobacillus backii]ANK64169.1 CAAX protease [Loigolactobacillus backii]ANK67436.1 CAAX protease [Loigolactobacillus backii]ANK70398.1 CAAX protease [Loigolactobacillus backii]